MTSSQWSQILEDTVNSLDFDFEGNSNACERSLVFVQNVWAITVFNHFMVHVADTE